MTGLPPPENRGPWVIQILAANGFDVPDDAPSYLKTFDIEAHDGMGDADATSDPDQAYQFETSGAALQQWRATSTTRPVRGDGRPNRPLTAFTITVLPLDEARKVNP